MQQSNFLGSQPNFVGYQAAERNSFSGDLFLIKQNVVLIYCLVSPENCMSNHEINSWVCFNFS